MANSGKPCWILSSRTLPVPEGEGVDVRMVNAAVSDVHGEMVASGGNGDLGSSEAGTSPPSSRMRGCSMRSP